MSVFDGVRIGDFTLHSGGSSPIMFNVPSMLWSNRDRKYIQDTLIARMPTLSYDAIVGIEFGGALLACLLSEWLADKRLGFYRKDGTVIVAGTAQRIMLIDDVETTGASFVEATAALEAAGHKVIGRVSFIRRNNE